MGHKRLDPHTKSLRLYRRKVRKCEKWLKEDLRALKLAERKATRLKALITFREKIIKDTKDWIVHLKKDQSVARREFNGDGSSTANCASSHRVLDQPLNGVLAMACCQTSQRVLTNPSTGVGPTSKRAER